MLLSLECRGCKATLTADSNLPPQKKIENATTANGRRADSGERINGRSCPPSSPSKNEYAKKGIVNTKNNIKKMVFSDTSDYCLSSSAGSCDIVGFFGGSREAILSSTSFSSDSAEYYSTKSKKKNKNAPPKRGTRTCGTKKCVGQVEEAKAVTASVDRGIAVERRSTDIYGDFRRSIVEMIMTKSKLRDADMNRLLWRYLSINSPEHHPIIIKAFSDIYKGCSLRRADDL